MGCARISCGWSKRLKLNETSGVSFRLRVLPRLAGRRLCAWRRPLAAAATQIAIQSQI
jgi:hypothetical protein